MKKKKTYKMRTTKFQVWDKLGKEMHDVFSLGWNVEGGKINSVIVFIKEIDKYRQFVPSRVVLREYTGLKDKKGKEIWEGDIVEVFLNGKDKPALKRTVIWEQGAFRIPVSGNGDYVTLSSKKVKIIGNIYEKAQELQDDRGDNSGKYENKRVK